MNTYFRIDVGKAVILTNQLEKLRRSALPNAIRNTLNSAAFDVKQNTMPASAKKNFIHRKPNFFKANSKVFMASGYDVNRMRSVVGFIHTNAKYNNYAVTELEQQEFSGKIPKRSFVPLDFARSGQSHGGQILPSNRLDAIKNLVDARKMSGRNAKEKFVKASIKAGKRGFVIGNLGKQTLFRINTVKRDKNGKTIIGKSPLYSFKAGRSVRIKKATHFMREASLISQRKMEYFYRREALKQIQRVIK